jgi:hypothetical protein
MTGTHDQMFAFSEFCVMEFVGRHPCRDLSIFYDEIKSRLNSGNACYHSVQNLLFSYLI